MNKVYLGDEEVLGCFLGDDKVDAAFLGDDTVCEMTPAPAPAVVYDAYVLGASLSSGTVKMSIFHDHDGVTQNHAMDGEDILSGAEFLVNIHWQDGLNETHIDHTFPCAMVNEFNLSHDAQLYYDINSTHGHQPITGLMLIDIVNNNKTIKGHWDSAQDQFLINVL